MWEPIVTPNNGGENLAHFRSCHSQFWVYKRRRKEEGGEEIELSIRSFSHTLYFARFLDFLIFFLPQCVFQLAPIFLSWVCVYCVILCDVFSYFHTLSCCYYAYYSSFSFTSLNTHDVCNMLWIDNCTVVYEYTVGLEEITSVAIWMIIRKHSWS